MALQIENITKTYGTDVILKDVSLTASDNARIGLIGANGAGKSTLLRIIAGELSYDEGRVIIPKDTRVGFLRQDTVLEEDKTIWEYMMSVFNQVTELELELRSLESKMSKGDSDSEHDHTMALYGAKSEQFEKMGGFEIKTRIDTILTGMGFNNFDINMKIANLSGGEKTKLAMARLLLECPGVLLLDEPTNHLDFKVMQWLEAYLKSYKGIIITVSHDRYFLDAVTDTIYELEFTKITRYSGNYSKYLVLKKQNQEIMLKHYNARVDEAHRLEDYVRRNMARASTSKMAKSKQKALERIDISEKPMILNEACRFRFEEVFRSYNDVLTVENVTLRISKSGILENLAQNISLAIKRGEKAAIIGANGVGKSTLLKCILSQHAFFEGDIDIGRNTRISYYDQQQRQLSDDKTVFDEISDRFPLMDAVDIRTGLGTVLFKNDDVFKKVGNLSGGERARLMFLIIMLEKPNFLILDEPTNHLDLAAKESLDTAIAEFDGTVLFVSHDRYFLNKTADVIFELTPEGTREYRGNYDDYISRTAQTVSTRTDNKPRTGDGAADYETAKRYQANIRSIQKKIDSAEERIASLEEKIRLKEEELNLCGSDFQKAGDIYDEKNAYECELESVYELWNKLNEQLEQITE